jgi:hypothetical protein
MRILEAVLVLPLCITFLAPVWAEDATDVPAEAQQQPLLNAGQLDQLVAPIALYPDPLLAQVLMAATYPLEVVQADRFAKSNKSLKGDKLTQALDKKDWDPSVKQLVSTPTVLSMMSDQLDWTENLGDAVLAQQADLMDSIQRLRGQAEANGKLKTTKQQKVTINQQANKQVIEIEPAAPDVVYVPYYNPSVVYGTWAYPAYPPYYYPPPSSYIVGGAIASGLAWGAAFAIGHEIWDDFDWDRGDINVDIDRNVNRNVERNFSKWEHNSYHRRGVNYNNDAVREKFGQGGARAAADRKLDYRGRGGDQVLNNVGQGVGKPGGKPGGPKLGADVKPPKANSNIGQGGQLGGGDLGKKPKPGQKPKPNVGQIEQGLKDHGKPKGQVAAKAKAGGANALDLSDGAWAKDFSDRGHSSLGNRGTKDFARPSGGGRPNVSRPSGGRPSVSRPSGRPNVSRPSGARPSVSRGGGGGGRGGGRRSDINLKQDILPLARLNNGLELYRFRYTGGDPTLYVGVMAQDVEKVDPGAVWRARDGFLRVDYDRIGVKFMTWKAWLARHDRASVVTP